MPTEVMPPEMVPACEVKTADESAQTTRPPATEPLKVATPGKTLIRLASTAPFTRVPPSRLTVRLTKASAWIAARPVKELTVASERFRTAS